MKRNQYSRSPEISATIKELLAKGCTYDDSRGPHPKLVFPSGRRFAIPMTPSDWRAVKNFQSQLRRMVKEEGL